MFDSGGSTGRLRACPFGGTWRALLCEEIFVRALDEPTACWGGWVIWSYDLAGGVQRNRVRCMYCGRSLFFRSQAVFENVMPSTTARGHLRNGVNEC